MATKFITPSWRMPKNSNQSKASNYSLDFDGATSKINLGDSDIFSFGDGSTDSPLSFSVWINLATLSTPHCVINKQTSSSNGEYKIYISTAGKIYIELANNGGEANGARGIQSGTNLSIDQWYHLAFTYDGRGGSSAYDGMNLYINGSLDSSTDWSYLSYTAMNNTNADFILGDLITGGSNTYDFQGKMGPVSIFDYALTSSAVTALYNNGIPANPLAVATPPVAYYDLGQGSAYAEGSAGIVEPNLAQATGSTVFEFDGPNANEQYIDTPFAPNGYTKCTVSQWLNTSAFSARSGLFATHGNSANDFNAWFNTTSQGYLYIYVGGANALSINQFYDLGLVNKWFHLTLVYDGTFTDADTATQNAGRIKMYINGSYVAFNNAGSGTIPSSIPTGNTGMYIGTYTPTSYEYGGKMSNAQIWNESLTAAEVSTLYNNGTPLQSNIPQSGSLKAWYKLGLDTSNWDGSNWQLSNSAANYSTALDFEGSDRINVNSVSSVFSDASNFTISGWFNWENYSNANEWLFMAASTNVNARRVQLETYNKQLYFGFLVDSASAGVLRVNMTTDQWDAKWVHMVAVFDANAASADKMIVYFNGVRAANAAYTEPTGNSPTDIVNVSFGNRTDGLYNFEGIISNFAVYNTSLSSANALSLYNSGTPQNTILGSPQGWWKLDSTTITDSSGNGNTGTNNGATQVLSLVSTLNGVSSGMDTTNLVASNLIKSIPYSGYSMDFDGTDFIDASAFSSNISGDWTISFWFNVPAYDATIQYALGFELGTGLDGGIFTDYSGVYANKWGFYRGNAVYPADSALSVGNWHHCVITRTGNNLAFYADGVADGTDTNTDSMDIASFRIGERSDDNWGLTGKISNVSTFNRVLTQDEILRVYNGGSPGDLSSLNPLNWWSLGADSYYNGSNWICPDLGTNSNNGTGDGLGADDLVGIGPDSLANGTSTNLDLATDLIGEAPGSTGNAISINMNSLARTGSTP